MRPLLVVALFAILLAGFVLPAHAADLDAKIDTTVDNASATFTAVKTITMKYEQGGSISNQLNGKNDKIEFTISGTASDPNMAGLIQANNKVLLESNSPVRVASATVHYIATLKGGPSSAQMLVKVEYQPTIQKFVMLKEDAQTGGDIIDLQWRAFKIDGPIKVNSGTKYGEININQAIGALEALYPDLASKLSSSGAQAVLTEPVMDFTKFNIPMTNWHFLFDQVGTNESGVARALSVYSLGESSFREGTFEAQETTGSASIDGQTIAINSQTPPPSGQITIAGYSKLQGSAGQEYATVTKEVPSAATTTTDDNNKIMGLSSDVDGNTYFVLAKSATITPIHYTIDPNNLIRFEIPEGQGGELQLTLPKSMIDQIHTVRNGEGKEIQFQQVLLTSTSTTIKFTVPDSTESIEVLDTHVVPEFPLSLMLIVISIGAVLIATNAFNQKPKLRFS